MQAMQHDAIFHPGRSAANREDLLAVRLKQFKGPVCAAVYALALATLLLSSAWPAKAAALYSGFNASGGHTGQATRPPGYLGIEFHDLTAEQAAAMHLRGPQGVEVLLVDHDGPAAQAGLRPHDLITGLNGRMVASGEALHRMIRDAGAGVVVTLAVFRNGSPLTVRAKLANQQELERQALARVNAPPPEDETIVSGFTETYSVDPQPAPAKSQTFITSMLHTPPFTGLVVEAMQPQLASFFGAPAGQGLLVQAVDSGSPGAAAGLRAGDIILRADNQSLKTVSEWSKLLYAGKGKPISLSVLHDHHEVSVTLQPDPKRRSSVESPRLPFVVIVPVLSA
jgi:serine protease Do